MTQIQQRFDQTAVEFGLWRIVEYYKKQKWDYLCMPKS